MPDQGQGVPGLHFNFSHSDLSHLVSVSSLYMYGLVSPEDVGGVPSCLAEVDLVSAVILVQGHLKQAVLSKQFKASGMISWQTHLNELWDVECEREQGDWNYVDQQPPVLSILRFNQS